MCSRAQIITDGITVAYETSTTNDYIRTRVLDGVILPVDADCWFLWSHKLLVFLAVSRQHL